MAKIIKISQGGKTLSFFLAVAIALCAAASAFADGLSEGYTQLPYIKAIANVQLKTGYTPSPTDKIVMTWRPAQTNSQETLWCARQSTSSPRKAFFAYMYSGKIRIIFQDYTSPVQSDANFTVNKCDPVAPYAKYTAIADGNAKTFTVTNDFTGAEVLNVSWTFSASSEVGSQLCLFASHGTSTAAANASWSSHILYSFKVYDAAGTLKLDLVPAKNSGGTIGLYDTVSGNFKTQTTKSENSNITGSLSDTLTFYDDYTLVDDEVLGKISVASGKTLNLYGHSLTASSIAGSGTITDTMADITAPDPNAERVTSDPSDLGSYHAKVLFNNNFSRGSDVDHRLLVAASKLPLKVDYDLGEGKPLNAYKIYFEATSGNFVNRAPKEWKFYGSNDKEKWTYLDERTSETGWKTKENRTYAFTNSTPYRYYRIEFIEQNGKDGDNYEFLELIQLEYFYDVNGEFHLNVPSGETVNNTTVSLAGKFRLVKEGDGAYIAAKANQTYTGGTELRGGLIDSSSASLANPFGSISAVAVYSRIDIHALNHSTFNIKDGATIDLSGCDGAYDASNFAFASGANVTVDVSGRTLSLGDQLIAWDEVPQNVTFRFDAATAAGGVAPTVTERGLLYGVVANTVEEAWWTGGAGDGDVANPANWLCKNVLGETLTDALPSAVTHVYLEGTLATNVQNLACRVYTLTNAALAADCDLRGFGPLEIASSSTLDLNGYKLHATEVVGTGTITGAVADVTVPDSNGNHVSCTTSFNTGTAANLFNNIFERNTSRIVVAKANFPLVVDYDFGDGTPLNAYRIYFEGASANYVCRAPRKWKFYGSNDKSNWTCLDERTSETGWKTKENRTYTFTNSTSYRYYRIEFVEQNGADSYGTFLELIQLEYFYLEGELHLHVPAGVTNSNSTVSFNGSIKLVKEGEGAFIAAKTGQQYAGGTDILGGTVRLVAGAQGQLLGALSSRVSVASGATLDVCDNTQVYRYKVVSAGGTLTNSGSGLANNVGQIGSLTLTDDSVLDSTHSLGLMKADYSTTSLDLGGHTLDVQILGGGIFRISNCDATNGTVRVTTTGSGDISFINGETRASTVDFDLSCNVKPYANATVRSLLLRERCSTVKDTLTLSVLGCFRTETDDFPNVRLEDGATLDLSGREGVLSTAGSSAHEDHYYLTFADGATIKVSIGSRQGFGSSKVVDWTGNQPAANVNFTCADGENFGLRKKSDGLYIYKGFIMIVR